MAQQPGQLKNARLAARGLVRKYGEAGRGGERRDGVRVRGPQRHGIARRVGRERGEAAEERGGLA